VTEDQAPRVTKKAAAKAEEEPREPIVTRALDRGDVREGDLVEVRTTMRPDQPMKVSQAEALDLEAQGLLVKEEGTDAR